MTSTMTRVMAATKSMTKTRNMGMALLYLGYGCASGRWQ